MDANRHFKNRFILGIAAVAMSFTTVEADVVINELMARNRGAHTNASGDDRSDWIELHNNGSSAVNLTGWHLTDDAFDLTQWTFPAASIPAGGYLLVYASNSVESVILGELHANFALSTGGENLVLVAADGTTVVDAIEVYEFSPGQLGFPPQTENISYGRSLGGEFAFFESSTPGVVNAGGAEDFVADTTFSVDRGFFSEPFVLEIDSRTPDAEIYYTLNGGEPDSGSTLYTEPITISGTTCVRARAYKDGLYPTNIDTQTYIFVDDVIQQSPTGNTPPSSDWPGFDVNGQAMQYGMDPDITQDSRYADVMDDALLSIPTISLVADLDSLFGASEGIYVNADREGIEWERVTSVELLNPDGKKGFQENAGLRIRGGASRADRNPKHAFRLRFRREYGASRLEYKMFGEDGADSFNGVDLRCAQTPSYNFNSPTQNTHLRDLFSRDLQLACGQPSTRGDHYHLYINGVYWGMYQTQEHIEGDYAQDYLGGAKEDYDIIEKKKHGYKIEGSESAYAQLWGITNDGYASNANYYKAQGLDPDGVTPNSAYPKLLDVENLMDYMLITYYTGEKDGPASVWANVNNYATIINRENPDGFKHFEYDSEWSLGIGVENVVRPINRSAWTQLQHFNGHYLHEQLVDNEEYRIAFADRVHKRMFNDGLMTADKAIGLFQSRADEIDLAVIAETARWGDALNDAIPHTKDDHWVPAVNAAKSWMQGRTPTVLTQLRNAGWYPSLAAPTFNQHGGSFTSGFQVNMSGTGTIVYTLDGTDPREIITGAMQGQVYTGPVTLTHGAVVKARSMTSITNWSALNEAIFVADGPNTLRISEVMYHPREPGIGSFVEDDYEFIEIQNTGPGVIGLAGVELRGSLGEGVSFDFSGGNVASVPSMGHVLVVSNLAAFSERYDTTGLAIAGEYSGNLDNGGDAIELVTLQGEVLASFDYGDGRDWPLTADGAGHSLIPLVTDDQTGEPMEFGGNWRASSYLDGSPGAADVLVSSSVVLNEVEANTSYNNPTPPFDQYNSNDGIELYNTGSGVVSLNAWYLSDDADDLKKWAIPTSVSLAGQSWRWFSEVDDFNSPGANGFGINKSGETIFLSYLPGTSADRVVDAVELEGQAEGTSWARLPDGTGYWGAGIPTQGSANARPAVGLVINEVMYHPAPTASDPVDNRNDEYIEIFNASTGAIDLFEAGLTWRVSGGVDFAFPTGTSLAPGQCLAVVSFDPNDPYQAEEKAAFLKSYRQFEGETQLFGPFFGSLSNGSDRITLEKPLAPGGVGETPAWFTVDEMTYYQGGPWPIGAGGTGVPIQRADVAASANDPGAWYVSGFASPGFPDSLVELLSPSSGSTLLIPVLDEMTVAIDWSRISGGVSRVDFLLDDGEVFSDTSMPYSYQLTLADISTPGSHTLQVRIVDEAGAHLSRAIPIEAEFATRVVISGLENGQGLVTPYSVEVVAEVREDLVIGDVNQVEFFLDGELVGIDGTAPYTYQLSQPSVPGSYELTAVMTDDLFSTTSPVVAFEVFDTAPLVDLSKVPDHSILFGNETWLEALIGLNGLPADLVSVEWMQRSGPGTVSFGSAGEAATSAGFSTAGVYELELLIRFGGQSISEVRTITVEAGNDPSTIRFEESFENYIEGTELLGFNGWFGSTAPLVTGVNYALGNGVDHPIAYAEHTQGLIVEESVTKRFSGTEAIQSLWIDSVCEMTYWRNPNPPEDRESAQLQIYVGDDGLLRVWNTPDPLNAPNVKGWTVLTGAQVADGAFHRLTIHADYQREASGHFHFEIYLDGVQVTAPVSRFASANSDNTYLTQLVMSGPFTLDDLVVDERNPFSALYLIRSTSGDGGGISPSTNVFVEAGADQGFSITPNQFFEVADVLVDDVSVGAVTSYQFSSVDSNHDIEAVFTPSLTTNGTPYWWLHQQNPAWAADFEAAAQTDHDGDQAATWEEYLSDTNPLDGASYFWIQITKETNSIFNFKFPASIDRKYHLQRQEGGLDGLWVDDQRDIDGQPDEDGVMTVQRPIGLDPRVFYRVKAELR